MLFQLNSNGKRRLFIGVGHACSPNTISHTLLSNLFSSKNTISYFKDEIFKSSDTLPEPKFLLRVKRSTANAADAEQGPGGQGSHWSPCATVLWLGTAVGNP